MKFTIRQFNTRFPTSDACLEELKQLRFADYTCANCGRENMLSKVSGRPVYACPCGKQVHPLSGTIFHKSSTDLRTWFLAMYLMTTTRSGVSAKHIERMTGVTYKTAWRMMKEIRSLMENGGLTLSGIVEVDETYVGGVQKGMRGRNPKNTNKTVVMGMVERGGRLKTQVVPNAKAPSLLPHIQKSVAKGTWIVSDELYAYKPLTRMGYPHDSINHSRQYVDGNIHTNTIEGFWSQLKLGIRCVYRHVDRNYLQSYANEYAWRYSYRKSEVPMFDLLLGTTSR